MTTQTILFILAIVLFAYFWKKEQRKKQLRFIENYKFSPVIIKRVKAQHDYLSDKDMKKVVEATRDYFYICNQAKGKMVAMPSEIVDVLWHEFLLFTREYQEFCQKGIGRFLHHTPTEAMKSPTSAQEGIKRAWRLACAKEGIDPKAPKKLPLLFAIDSHLKIKGGFKYKLNCKGVSSSHGSSCGAYCATDIGCASGCAGDSGSDAGYMDSSTSSSSSDGGGFFGGGSSGDGGGSSCGGGGCGGS
jgi:hypothetical protein